MTGATVGAKVSTTGSDETRGLSHHCLRMLPRRDGAFVSGITGSSTVATTGSAAMATGSVVMIGCTSVLACTGALSTSMAELALSVVSLTLVSEPPYIARSASIISEF
jgi:hypothetical protein